MKYCIDPANYERFPTREVRIGSISIGANAPIRLQSMTNTPTSNIVATANQCMRIFDAGADFVRITTPTVSDANCLAEIKKKLQEAGYKKPLIADIHFNPAVAEIAARMVEKIRINPGNYIDKKQGNLPFEYTELSYKTELEKIHTGLRPLIDICKQHGTAIRIGSNHGSLSRRIVQHYGNTVEGMVEAAMEYIAMFVAESFYNLVISMKASDVNTTVKACRLLNAKMLERGWNFPQHLGVTEAGEGEDGRMKSALGIVSLLNDGIGDTIRVSLTEPPEKEIVFAEKLVAPFQHRKAKIQNLPLHSVSYNMFDTGKSGMIPVWGNKKMVVVSHADEYVKLPAEVQVEIDYVLHRKKTTQDFDYLMPVAKNLTHGDVMSIFSIDDIINQVVQAKHFVNRYVFIETTISEFQKHKAFFLKYRNNCGIIFKCSTLYPAGELRCLHNLLSAANLKIPVLLSFDVKAGDNELLCAEMAEYPGSVLIDRLCGGIVPQIGAQSIGNWQHVFSMLQALGLRYTCAEFISCPSCGRTQYDIETIVKQVKIRFSHLKGIKIAVMGCVVNGPGEMSDADYGYVGAQKGVVHLYKGSTAVLKNVPEGKAIDALVSLIKENGDWIEPNFQI